MLRTALVVLLLAYLPGALIFRFPLLDRARRAALAAEERLFWAVVLSVALSSLVAFSLAVAGSYALERVLWLNGAVCLGIALGCRGRLWLGTHGDARSRESGETSAVTRAAAAPLALAALAAALFFFVPPSEYVNGGRDPGVYFNSGIQIAQRGAVVIDDPLVRAIPPEHRELFFRPRPPSAPFDTVRFLGFFVVDQEAGTVVGQFPHLYPVWIALAYDTLGLTGARYVHGLWAVLGVLAVYFAGAFVLGRRAALAGALLLTLHVAQVWFARYFSAEMLLQPLVFAGALAYARAHVDGDRFFAPVAAVLLALTLFAHLTGIIAIAAVGLAALLARGAGLPVRASFLLPLAALTAVGAAYYGLVLTPYLLTTLEPFRRLPAPAAGAAAGVLLLLAGGLWLAGDRPAVSHPLRRWLPFAAAAALPLLAAYALLVREPLRRALELDPEGLTTFTVFYVTPLGLAAALAGWLIASRHRFWQGSALLLVAAAFAVVFFSNPRITPDHFWAARRYVSIILPACLLLAGAAAFTPVAWPDRFRLPRADRVRTAGGMRPTDRVRLANLARTALGVLLMAVLGWQYAQASRPILRHTEHAGMIPDIEALAARFAPDDLLLFAARAMTDAQVFALPLAYIYDRDVLVLTDNEPDPDRLRRFLDWARARYARVFFIGSGTRLLSSRTQATPVADVRTLIPFYDRAFNAYPQGVDQWAFDYGIYQLLDEPVEPAALDLDVGASDHLHVRHMHDRSVDNRGVTYRWTTDRSLVWIVGTLPNARALTLRLSRGGRPPEADEARVSVFLDDQPLGTIAVADDAFRSYTLPIPASLASAVAATDTAATLRLETSPWVPLDLLGIPDRRELGVMLDRIEIH